MSAKIEVRKAVVLAAGLGTRLRPLTCATPKPLMPVWGVPLLERIVGMLREHGVDDIVVNCHYLHGQVEAWCREHGCRASYEPEILGTGGVLNPLRDWIGGENFILANGDIAVENVPEGFWSPEDSADTLGWALVSEEGPRTIEIEPESRIVTNWRSDEPGWSGTCTYCGLAVLKPEILGFVRPEGFSTIVEAYEKAMMTGRFVRAVGGEDLLWTDAGTIESYVDLNRDGGDNAFADFPQLRAAFPGAAESAEKIEFLGARGSDRVFFRRGGDVAVIYDDAKRGENAKYAAHARWLRARGASVPEIRAELADVKTLVMEWGGVERKMKLEEYVRVVEALERFNRLGAENPPDLEPPFDAALYRWERELFAEHCLGTRYLRTMPDAVRAELENVAAILEREPKALVHRDFQSTNVLWKNDALCFIDFQGMRLGPAAYDLASLVYDPYVTFTEGERRALVALYAKRAERPELVKILPYAAVQRLVQCLGAYGRLASVGQPQFGRHVLPALQNLLDAADKAGLDAVGALAEDLIAEEQKARGRHHHHDDGCECHCH